MTRSLFNRRRTLNTFLADTFYQPDTPPLRRFAGELVGGIVCVGLFVLAGWLISTRTAGGVIAGAAIVVVLLVAVYQVANSPGAG